MLSFPTHPWSLLTHTDWCLKHWVTQVMLKLRKLWRHGCTEPSWARQRRGPSWASGEPECWVGR